MNDGSFIIESGRRPNSLGATLNSLFLSHALVAALFLIRSSKIRFAFH
jgi:hypothetical protein